MQIFVLFLKSRSTAFNLGDPRRPGLRDHFVLQLKEHSTDRLNGGLLSQKVFTYFIQDTTCSSTYYQKNLTPGEIWLQPAKVILLVIFCATKKVISSFPHAPKANRTISQLLLKILLPTTKIHCCTASCVGLLYSKYKYSGSIIFRILALQPNYQKIWLQEKSDSNQSDSCHVLCYKEGNFLSSRSLMPPKQTGQSLYYCSKYYYPPPKLLYSKLRGLVLWWNAPPSTHQPGQEENNPLRRVTMLCHQQQHKFVVHDSSTSFVLQIFIPCSTNLNYVSYKSPTRNGVFSCTNLYNGWYNFFTKSYKFFFL